MLVVVHDWNPPFCQPIASTNHFKAVFTLILALFWPLLSRNRHPCLCFCYIFISRVMPMLFNLRNGIYRLEVACNSTRQAWLVCSCVFHALALSCRFDATASILLVGTSYWIICLDESSLLMVFWSLVRAFLVTFLSKYPVFVEDFACMLFFVGMRIFSHSKSHAHAWLCS